MLVFKKLELCDIEKIRPFIERGSSLSCDNSIGGIFLWRDLFKMQYCIEDGTLFLKAKGYDGKDAFAVPAGENTALAIEKIRDLCEKNGDFAVFSFVSEDILPLFDGFSYEKEEFRDWFDYVYDKEEFIGLKGRRYNGQRNHINRFTRLYPDHVFERITRENVCEVAAFYDAFCKTHPATDEKADEDKKKTRELLENYESYGLLGGLIRVAGKIAAFSVGELLGDVLFVHVEKADTSYSGIYPVMANTFASSYAGENVKYINREDDAGDAGLRTAKLSYHPKLILPKYQITLK